MASGAARHRGLGTASVLVTASEAAPWPAVLSRWPSGTLPGSYPPPSRLLEPQVCLTCVCSARRLCPDRGWPGAGWGDLGRLGLPPWGSRYWLNVDQSAGRQVVAAGCVGSPFSHKALATGSTRLPTGLETPLLCLPRPHPPTLRSAAQLPALRPGSAPTHTRPPLTTGKLSGFHLGAACSSALGSDVTSSRKPARTPTSSAP